MYGLDRQRGARAAAIVGLLFAAWLGQAACAQAEEPPGREARLSVRLGTLPGYAAAAPLGFRLADTAVDEQAYRRVESAGQGLVWSATFTSRWALDADRLDRWNAQAITLVADGLGPDVQPGAYERLDARDVGEQRVAYRYQLMSAAGARVGEATVVVFARGAEVGMSATASTGAVAPLDAVALARGLDSALAAAGPAARVS